MHKVLFIIICMFSQFCNAQFVEIETLYLAPNKSAHDKQSSVLFKLSRPVSSLGINIQSGYTYSSSSIITGRDTFDITASGHNMENEKQFSNLVIFPEPIDSFLFYYAGIRDSVSLFLINDKPASTQTTDSMVVGIIPETGNFEMPDMIDQSVWRAGLKEPDFERIVHEVHNVIIHHSGSSNLLIDYTSAIRNIYLYHTEVRGWSDIGYNYVIAANGDIYKGRDPGIYDQDRVMGAHFCNNNRGTMGICMLGTFTDIAPTDAASDALEKLLVWKLGKDDMDPLGQYAHPLNSELSVIAAHLEGCSTECPGEVLSSRLGLMRARVNNKILILGIDMIGEDQKTDDLHIFPNPFYDGLSVTSRQKIERLVIHTLDGNTLKEFANPSGQNDLSDLKAGMYLVSIKTKGKTYYRRIIKR